MGNTEYNFLKEQVINDLLHYQVIDSHSSMPIELQLPNNVLSRVLSAYQKFVEETRQASRWIINDDNYDLVWFAGEQFSSSVADIVIKKPTLLENQNATQDDDYEDNRSSDNDDDYEDASGFCDTFTE
ncbi:hypothetical protein TNCV_1609891 [Trichonephila clavipes]|nr:hypothetical protein TNCV_1609891 [Trichonephila clavipes]